MPDLLCSVISNFIIMKVSRHMKCMAHKSHDIMIIILSQITNVSVHFSVHNGTTKVDGLGRLLDTPTDLCFVCLFAWSDLLVAPCSSSFAKKSLVASDRQSSFFTKITSPSLSSLDIISGTHTFRHFSFSFSLRELLFKRAWRVCSF